MSKKYIKAKFSSSLPAEEQVALGSSSCSPNNVPDRSSSRENNYCTQTSWDIERWFLPTPEEISDHCRYLVDNASLGGEEEETRRRSFEQYYDPRGNNGSNVFHYNSCSPTSSSSSSSLISSNSTSRQQETPTKSAIKKVRKKEDNLLPKGCKFSKTEIVDTPIDTFNKLLEKLPKEERTLCKDSRRKGKNRGAARRARDRRIQFFNDLYKRRDMIQSDLYNTKLSLSDYEEKVKYWSKVLDSIYEQVTHYKIKYKESRIN